MTRRSVEIPATSRPRSCTATDQRPSHVINELVTGA